MIIIAPDSFKGSLSSDEVADAIADGILSTAEDVEILKLPMADGGEGTAKVIARAMNARWIECDALDPLGRHISATYAIAETNGASTAIIDVASASGLCLVPTNERDIMHSSSYGTGMLISHAIAHGCRHFIIGLGGSATCDGGLGLLSALGYNFLDLNGKLVQPIPAYFHEISSIDTSEVNPYLCDCDFKLVCDVDSPLCGLEGAAYVFAPQKGASPEETTLLDSGLRHISQIYSALSATDPLEMPGSGAAGGIGAAFMAMFCSTYRSGADAIIDLVVHDNALSKADIVITGEGHIDAQTLHGKLPMAVCRRALRAGVPTIALAGLVSDAEDLIAAGFADVIQTKPADITLEEAMKPAVARAALAQAAKAFTQFREQGNFQDPIQA